MLVPIPQCVKDVCLCCAADVGTALDYHDDLDAVFASAASPQPAQSRSRENADDPFDIFGGLAAPRPSAGIPDTSPGADLLGGMNGMC